MSPLLWPLGLVLFPISWWFANGSSLWLMGCLSGAALSLTIEILQSFIPTCYAGLTDVITNSTGTALGASVYLSGAAHRLLEKVFGEQGSTTTN